MSFKNANYDFLNVPSYEKTFSRNDEVEFSGVKNFLYLFFKRFFDIIFSSVALVVLFIPMVVVGIIVKLEDHGPAFYVQERVGKNGKKFKMYKFRSMHVGADDQKDTLMDLNERDGPAFKMKNDPRITKFGKFIRKSCIDELPQLINILMGNMSIVGPRPPLEREVRQYNQVCMKRLTVKPGLTCYWQVKRTSSTSFEEWINMDLEYIETRSLWVDFKLILLTITSVLSGKCLEEG